MSNLEILSPDIEQTSIKSANLKRLARLRLQGRDSPSALMEVSAAKIKNLVSIGQSRSMRLYFLALPAETDWPSTLPDAGKPIDEIDEMAVWRWLLVLYEAALAIQQPMLHHGFIQLGRAGMKPFQRVVYPVTPPKDRPSNYRVLTVAEIIDNETLIII